ncbi:hypothetical protein NDU88_003220 [Pleurodeles waltl]|uniref:Uncharacterized protein n=1 Tax=Pleurodeles waltl TaxID=8319 RepID=A0AAV7VCR2_PLEWA|nr:hypothetical protein NDU88_003220 [Pleurodeles waltl]
MFLCTVVEARQGGERPTDKSLRPAGCPPPRVRGSSSLADVIVNAVGSRCPKVAPPAPAPLLVLSPRGCAVLQRHQAPTRVRSPLSSSLPFALSRASQEPPGLHPSKPPRSRHLSAAISDAVYGGVHQGGARHPGRPRKAHSRASAPPGPPQATPTQQLPGARTKGSIQLA